MKMSSPMSFGWRLIRVPLILLALYLALHTLLTTMSARHGFGSPDGLGTAFPILAATVLTLRILLLTVVPAVLTYRVVLRALRPQHRERSETP
ncbi:hypothetical protein ACFWU5_09735 [Nocardia sp. NPDC058640]|uniref:hypothetical protein n=1 Tax=Nocardia sp. NPDC058640 TaxID=3346571 RepID=UPI00365C077A